MTIKIYYKHKLIMSFIQCSICLEHMRNDLYLCPRCKNYFHNKCIIKLLNYNHHKKLPNNCPLCRKELEIYETTPLIVNYEVDNHEPPNRCEHLICRFLLCCCNCIFR